MIIVQGWRNMTFCLKPNNKSSQIYKSLSVWKTNKRYWEHTKSEDTEKKSKKKMPLTVWKCSLTLLEK